MAKTIEYYQEKTWRKPANETTVEMCRFRGIEVITDHMLALLDILEVEHREVPAPAREEEPC